MRAQSVGRKVKGHNSAGAQNAESANYKGAKSVGTK